MTDFGTPDNAIVAENMRIFSEVAELRAFTLERVIEIVFGWYTTATKEQDFATLYELKQRLHAYQVNLNEIYNAVS